MDEPTAAPAQDQHPRTRARAQLPPAEWAKQYHWPKGVSGNPGGKPKGASPRAAAMRELAARPDADGIGEVAGKIGSGLVRAAEKLTELATAERIDPDQVKAVQGALAGLVTWLDSIEPNVRKSERVETSQRVFIVTDETARAVDVGASEVGAGPMRDAPLPALDASPHVASPQGPPSTDPHPTPVVQKLDSSAGDSVP